MEMVLMLSIKLPSQNPLPSLQVRHTVVSSCSSLHCQPERLVVQSLSEFDVSLNFMLYQLCYQLSVNLTFTYVTASSALHSVMHNLATARKAAVQQMHQPHTESDMKLVLQAKLKYLKQLNSRLQTWHMCHRGSKRQKRS